MDKFVPQHEKALDSYLFHIARHKWLDHLRSLPYKNTASLKPEHDTLMTFEDIDDKNIGQIQLMKDRFRHLGENCRRLLKRFYYGKESMKAIAEDMGWTEASAKNNKYRCMEKLREMMR